MEVALTPAAQWSLVIIALFNVLLFAGLVAAVFMGVQAFKKLQNQVQPVLDRVNPLLEEARPIVANVNPLINQNVKPILSNVQEITHKVSGIVTDVGDHIHDIAETGEHTVKTITDRVEAAGEVVTTTVSKPVINAASLITGINRAINVFKTYNNSDPEKLRKDETVHAGNGSGDGVAASSETAL